MPRLLLPSYGPVITAAVRGKDNGERGFCIEDGGYPGFAQWLVEMAQVSALLRRSIRLGVRYVVGLLGFDTDSNLSAELSAFVGGPRLRSASSLPLLGMGRDVPDGRIYLSRNCLRSRAREQVDWKRDRSARYFEALQRTMAAVAKALEADFTPNPLSHLRRLITVHPLGGCPMGRSWEEGVVDSKGEVFAYPGLFVVDGSAMPGPVGTNPSLTIAAFADRCAEYVIEKHRLRHPAARVACGARSGAEE